MDCKQYCPCELICTLIAIKIESFIPIEIISKAPFKCPMCRAVFEVEEEKLKGQGTTAASSLPTTTLPPLCWLLLHLLHLRAMLIRTTWCVRAARRIRQLNTAKIVLRHFAPRARGFISSQRPSRTTSSSRLMKE